MIYARIWAVYRARRIGWTLAVEEIVPCRVRRDDLEARGSLVERGYHLPLAAVTSFGNCG